MKILSLSVYFYLFFSLLFSHSTKATASQKVIEPEDGFTSLEEKNKAVVRVHKSHIGQGSGFFIGDSETLVISTYMLDVFTLLSNIDSSEQPRGNSLNSHLREGLEIPVLLKSNHSKSSEDLRQFLIASHLKTIAVIHEGNILNLRITGIALSSKDSIAVLKVKGYTGPYLQISDSLIHKDSEFYAASVQSKELTVIKGRNIPQKQRPRQISCAGYQLTLNS
ncbi:MAG: hypothetical protein OXH36_02935, partial [Bdellovibrionales bacterium]|nr:hypothetical protein [Bdellovibrionales bacterium]